MSEMLDAAIDLLTKQGFSVIPLRRDNKRPWLDSWKEFQTRLPTEEEVERWFTTWHDANVGIVTGAISNIVVVDADGAEGLRWMKEHLPVTSVYVQTGKGYHGYYRHPGGRVTNSVRIEPEVDIRADGGYVVAPPSIHANGGRYSFLFTPGLNGWDDLALYPAEGVKPASSGVDLTSVKPMVSTQPVMPGQRNDTLTSLVGQWVQKGMDPEAVMFAALGWNGGLPVPLKEDEVRHTVNSVFATHARNHPEQCTPEVVAVEVKPEVTGSTEVPERLLHPGGYLEQVMNYIEASSAVYHPMFALAASITLLGTLIGQKFCTETGLRTNIYAICLGFSGAGKNAPNTAIPRLLCTSHGAACWAGNGFTSESALMKHLAQEQHARGLAIFDEIGLLLTALKNPNNPAYTLPHALMKLYTGTQSGYQRNAADEKNSYSVKWHHFSFLGFSTPVRFWEGLTPESARDGFLARCDIFDSRLNGIEREGDVMTAIPFDLMEATNRFADMQPPLVTSGNLLNIPEPVVIPKTKEAAEYFRPFHKKYKELRTQYQETDEARSSIYNRVAERAHKMALIHAASLHGTGVKAVGMESVRWACELVEFLTENAIAQMNGNIAENEFHKLELRAMKVIRAYAAKSKENFCPAWRLSQYLKGATPRQIQDVVEKLKASGQIMETFRQRSGKSAPLYIPSEPVE